MKLLLKTILIFLKLKAKEIFKLFVDILQGLFMVLSVITAILIGGMISLFILLELIIQFGYLYFMIIHKTMPDYTFWFWNTNDIDGAYLIIAGSISILAIICLTAIFNYIYKKGFAKFIEFVKSNWKMAKSIANKSKNNK